MFKSERTPLLMVGILLLGMALRVAPISQNRFLEDEALYAFWGLQIASGADPMLNQEPVDKPPLHSYVVAFSTLLFSSPSLEDEARAWRGQEAAARLPSLYASLLSIALIYGLGRRLYRDARVGLAAALLLALSPFDILFASTAFTDPLLAVLVLAALAAAASERLGVAGFMAGLAVATKQQGLLFLPLVVAVGILAPRGWAVGRRRRLGWFLFAIGFVAVVGSALWWDLAREQRPGFLEQSYISYGGLGLIRLGDMAARGANWLQLLGLFWVSPLLNGILLASILGWTVGGLLGRWPGWSTTDLALGVFAGSFVLVHWVVDFQVWDRYLLGIVPLAALLAGRALVGLADAIPSASWQTAFTAALVLLLAVAMARPLLKTTTSDLPVGGDHGAYDGIENLAAYLRKQAPEGSVLYHHWLGYHYRFYLYNSPFRLHWYPDPEDLVRDATIYRKEPRYIGFASWRDSQGIESALAAAEIELKPVYSATRRDGTGSFQLYKLEGP